VNAALLAGFKEKDFPEYVDVQREALKVVNAPQSVPDGFPSAKGVTSWIADTAAARAKPGH
jgi:hypothetical protein